MENNEFEYTYTAPSEEQKREIFSIRRQYEQASSVDEKLDRLRKLNSFVHNFATAVSLIHGIVGTLIFGLGMSMILEWSIMFWGVLVSLIGLIPIALAYPMYNLILKRNKKKYGAEILRLSEELLNEE